MAVRDSNTGETRNGEVHLGCEWSPRGRPQRLDAARLAYPRARRKTRPDAVRFGWRHRELRPSARPLRCAIARGNVAGAVSRRAWVASRVSKEAGERGRESSSHPHVTVLAPANPGKRHAQALPNTPLRTTCAVPPPHRVRNFTGALTRELPRPA